MIQAGGTREKTEVTRFPAGSSLLITAQASGITLMRKGICRLGGLQIRTGTAITSMQSVMGPEGACIPVGTRLMGYGITLTPFRTEPEVLCM